MRPSQHDSLYDFIIVGAGAAGCVLANRLSADLGNRVLLLEAGLPTRRREVAVPVAFSKLFQTEMDWDYATEPQPQLGGRTVYWPRGKALGGSTAINAQVYQRGHPADFDRWASLGNTGWAYEDVLGYFKKSEHCARGASRYRGTGGPLHVADLRDPNPMTHAFVRAAAEADLRQNDDFNGAELEGVGYAQVTQKNGRRCSAADAYLRPVLGRANLRVITGAHTTRVLLESRRAVGVEYLQDAQRYTAKATREVILCGGAVNSPQVLMLSGIGPAAELKRHGLDVVCDLRGVGRNLQDHALVILLWRSLLPVSLLSATSLGNLFRFLFRGKGPLTSNVAEALAFVRSRPDLPAPDLELGFAPVLYLSEGLEAPSEHGFSIGVVLLQPESAGSVTLRSGEPLDPPRIQANYLGDEKGEDLERLVHGVKLARRIARCLAFDPYRGDELAPGARCQDDADLQAFIRARLQTIYHPVGTCKMGTDDSAVVDPQLRVHGVEGLRVVDASVMPVIVRAHPQAATFMIAEKAADLILKGPHA